MVIKAPTLSRPKNLLGSPDAGNSQFVAVCARSGAVLVVQIGGAVERGREQDVIRLAKLENGIVQ